MYLNAGAGSTRVKDMSLLELLMQHLVSRGPTPAQRVAGVLPGRTPSQEDFLLQQLRAQSDPQSLEALFQKYK